MSANAAFFITFSIAVFRVLCYALQCTVGVERCPVHFPPCDCSAPGKDAEGTGGLWLFRPFHV